MARARLIACASLAFLSLSTPEKTMAGEDIKQTAITVTHVEIRSAESFDKAAARLEASVKPLDPALLEAMGKGDAEAAKRIAGDAPLFIFSRRNHGKILQLAGQSRKAYQYEIGNPMTAIKMTQRRPEASLYAPLRVMLYETADGCAFAYDLPSSLFGQFGDVVVNSVAEGLDASLKSALLDAAR